uniref:Uncharacterized protein n=1 Tax=Parascaris equorum TaxID=6256 RepID=A0A914RBQ4_PAREQ
MREVRLHVDHTSDADFQRQVLLYAAFVPFLFAAFIGWQLQQKHLPLLFFFCCCKMSFAIFGDKFEEMVFYACGIPLITVHIFCIFICLC